MKSIVIFASGEGTNAEAIIQYFSSNQQVRISAIVCNRATAGVIARAKRHQIPCLLISKTDLSESDFKNRLQDFHPDLLVLAGFLCKIPNGLIDDFSEKIINLHPALLPKYGGKGMYGDHVHKAVKAAGDAESGITIHWVNEHYDDGNIILQARCPVATSDSPEDIAHRIHKLEHFFLPRTIEFLLNDLDG